MRTRIGAAAVTAALLVTGVVPATAQEAPPPAGAAEEAPTRRVEPRRVTRVLAAVAEELGLSPRGVVVALAKGETLADLAAENGSSGDELVDALTARLGAALDEAVAEGRIDPERAAEIRERSAERIETLVFEPHRRLARRSAVAVMRLRAAETISEMLGMTLGELRDAVAGGTTVAELAEERGVDVDELVAAVMAPLEERAARAVEAGRVDPDRVDERLERIRARIVDRLTSPAAGG